MYNYTLISPYTLQVTHHKENFQEKEICFHNRNSKYSFNPLIDFQFTEKYISGYSNILNAISKKSKVYFTLPISFDENTILQFTRDFLTACFYVNPELIVFDRSRCTEKTISCNSRRLICDHIEEMFKESNLPVVFYKSSKEADREGKSHDLETSFKFYNLECKNMDLMELRVISKSIHQIFDLKRVVFIYKEQGFFKKTNKKGEFKNLKNSYTLN